MFCQSLLYKNSIAHTEGTIQRLGFSLSTKFYQIFFTSILFTDWFCVNNQKRTALFFLQSFWINFQTEPASEPLSCSCLAEHWRHSRPCRKYLIHEISCPARKTDKFPPEESKQQSVDFSLPKVWLLQVLISVQANQINPQPINLG